jgi:hypothetical protein
MEGYGFHLVITDGMKLIFPGEKQEDDRDCRADLPDITRQFEGHTEKFFKTV